MPPKQKYRIAHPYLSIYSPKESLNDPTLHYYTEPQPGFQQVSLHRKGTKRPITMYYQCTDPEQYGRRRDRLRGKVVDSSPVLDFQYISGDMRPRLEEIVVDRSSLLGDSEWVKKYQPNKFIQLLTDDKINRNLLTWLKSWDPIVFNKPSAKKKTLTPSIFTRNLPNTNNMNLHNKNQSYLQSIFSNPRKLILLAGPPGCGKTTLVRVLANHCKYEAVEINASDDRSATNLIRKIEDIAGNDTMRGNKRPALICLDEIDGVAQGEANGIVKVLEYIEMGKKPKQQNSNKQQKQQTKQKGKSNITFSQPQKQKPLKPQKSQQEPTNPSRPKAHAQSTTKLNRPIIFICNDPFAKSLKELRSKAHVVYFSQLCTENVVRRMREILEREKVVIELAVLHKIAEICRNDIRSCVGVLQLVAREKRVHNKNPKDLINKMKLSFTRDNQSSINQFLHELISKKSEQTFQKGLASNPSPSSKNFAKYLQTQVLQIYNPSLLMQTFLQNMLHVQGIGRKFDAFIRVYEDLVGADMLIRNGWKYGGELEVFHVLPYLGLAVNCQLEDWKKIQFPSLFFDKLRKMKINKDILKTIHGNIPIQLRLFLNKQSIINGSYLLALFLAMQSSTTKQSQLVKSVSIMLTYNFSLRKHAQQHSPSIFIPQLDTLLSMGSRKPQILVSGTTRTLMQQNYQFFKQRKDMLATNQLRQNTTAMINQLHLHSRKKRNCADSMQLKYRFVEGTGTKISYAVTIGYFF